MYLPSLATGRLPIPRHPSSASWLFLYPIWIQVRPTLFSVKFLIFKGHPQTLCCHICFLSMAPTLATWLLFLLSSEVQLPVFHIPVQVGNYLGGHCRLAAHILPGGCWICVCCKNPSSSDFLSGGNGDANRPSVNYHLFCCSGPPPSPRSSSQGYAGGVFLPLWFLCQKQKIVSLA